MERTLLAILLGLLAVALFQHLAHDMRMQWAMALPIIYASGLVLMTGIAEPDAS